MKAAMLSFTENGRKMAGKIKKVLQSEEWSVYENVKRSGEKDSYTGSLRDWTKEYWSETDALIYVGAVGIAVRAIAPFVTSKREDPAVIVVDELGKYCIPILSGHIGGANEIAENLNRKLALQAIITTATDLNQKWAVDVFARKNELGIGNMKQAKVVSANLLAGKKVYLELEPEGDVNGKIPQELILQNEGNCPNEDQTSAHTTGIVKKIHIGVQNKYEEPEVLYLIPRAVILGIGCRKGTPAEKIEKWVNQVLQNHAIPMEAVALVASIDLKKEEPGLRTYCKKWGVPFQTFSREKLEQVEGNFSGSEFVKQITGVDNVCERSAICAGGEKILVHKTAQEGVTVAVAVKKWSVNFE